MANLDDSTDNYRIKDIIFFGSARRILLQSKNGPCPLLAICNTLLLRNVLKINGDTRYISFGELVAMVSDWLFESNAAASGDGSGAADLQESLSSCLEILPRLNIGLDVNCKFGGTSDFEFTRELAVFDLLDIGLYHGWIVGQEDAAAHSLIGQLSYNQIVERLIAFEEAQQAISSHPAQAAEASSTTDESQQEAWAKTHLAIEEGLVIKEFLDRTASQISYEGLLALHETVRERQLAVFFRNSHFNTMLKYNGKLYLLCTDIAFSASHLCWELFDQVDGDTEYCDADFQVSKEEEAPPAGVTAVAEGQEYLLAAGGTPSGLDPDALLAWNLMQQDLQEQQAEALERQRLREEQEAAAVAASVAAKAKPKGKAKADAATVAAQAEGTRTTKVKKEKTGRFCVLQ